MDKMKDKTLICLECSEEFIFTVGEQAFFHSKLLSEPKRCKLCRAKRRARLVPDPGMQEGNHADDGQGLRTSD